MIKSIKNSFMYLFVLSMIVLLTACGTDGNTGENSVDTGSSEFVSAIVLDDINASIILQYVRGGIDANATNAFGYKAVKITYNTVGQNNKPVVASGLLVIPSATDAYKAYLASLGKSFSVSMLCDNHGTIFTNAEAPTNVEVANDFNPNYSLALLTTGFAGFAGIFPDYIGYGESNDVAHPYMLKKASARASLDMIKASMKYMLDNDVVINYQLYISGYSQGGYNAMALAQEVENSFDSVTLKGVAPLAGPHDLEALANIEINASRIMVYPAFLGYLADSYSFYNDDLNQSDIVLETNSTKYHALFDGSNANVVIHANLFGQDAQGGFNTYTADKLFKTSFINDYQNNVNSVIRQKFIENKSYNNWTPQTRVNLVHCIDDEIIPFSMSQNAFNELDATGGDITLSPIPSSVIPVVSATDPFVHGRCASTAYGVAVKWFADIRSGAIK